MAQVFIEDLKAGTLYFNTIGSDIPRADMVQDNEAEYVIPWESWYIFDSGARLPNTSASDDLGFYPGTFGSASPLIRTYDVKNAGAVTLYARCGFWLPPEYVDAETVKIRAHAGMVTTVASSSATIDFVAYKMNEEGGIGSDLVSTSATTINSLTYADKDFTVDASTLARGDGLDIRMIVAVNDSATATAVIAAVGKVAMLLDVKG